MNLRLRRKDKGHHHTDAFDTSWPRNSARKECLRVKRIWTRMELGINIQNCSSDKGGAMKREESQVTVPQRPLLFLKALNHLGHTPDSPKHLTNARREEGRRPCQIWLKEAIRGMASFRGTTNISGIVDKSHVGGGWEQSQGNLIWTEVKMTMECQFSHNPTVTHKLPATVPRDQSTFLPSNPTEVCTLVIL